MTKKDVRSFADLQALAARRASLSLRRNDPVAWAYWRETEKWARTWDGSGILGNAEELPGWTRHFVRNAQLALKAKKPMEAALEYSRAKWLVILGRNLGITMDPRKTGINLDWLRGKKARKAAV